MAPRQPRSSAGCLSSVPAALPSATCTARSATASCASSRERPTASASTPSSATAALRSLGAAGGAAPAGRGSNAGEAVACASVARQSSSRHSAALWRSSSECGCAGGMLAHRPRHRVAASSTRSAESPREARTQVARSCSRRSCSGSNAAPTRSASGRAPSAASKMRPSSSARRPPGGHAPSATSCESAPSALASTGA
ncbi:hypothetical protein T492DRAFT_993290 [Pavlovales sp. CCMP2436]|nr:hypothetical protein T492DRAFT_993290 [Pavlovales sp. CCMP2436]